MIGRLVHDMPVQIYLPYLLQRHLRLEPVPRAIGEDKPKY